MENIQMVSRYRQHNPDAKYQLFCLGHAGGSAGYYMTWQKLLPKFIEPVILQLPGRGETWKQPPFTTWPEVLAGVMTAIEAVRDQRPVAIFGHSLGALIGFEVARELQLRGQTPAHLIVSGMSAPQHYHVPKLRYTLPDEELINYVDNLDANTPKDDAYYDYVRFFLPTIRADFQLVDTYQYKPDPLLDCPISTIGGQDDCLYPPESLISWQEVTKAQHDLKIFPGGHMFLAPERTQVLEYISSTLGRIAINLKP
ncbi:MAG: thioesterase II family protein [Gammaproteobacteria bacterium]